MDSMVGMVLNELEMLGLEQSTIVAFVGDHGWQLGDLGEFGKKTNFERATRAPLIIRDPANKNVPATSSALVEFVDLMPTLLELAMGKVVPSCPPDSANVALCTEGQSLVPIMADVVSAHDSRDAAFMQYAPCMHDEMIWHDACAADMEPRAMGYAIRTRRWRYVEWVRFDKSTHPPTPLWNQTLGTELYDHTDHDTVDNSAEAINLVSEPALQEIVGQLSKMLRKGITRSVTRSV